MFLIPDRYWLTHRVDWPQREARGRVAHYLRTMLREPFLWLFVWPPLAVAVYECFTIEMHRSGLSPDRVLWLWILYAVGLTFAAAELTWHVNTRRHRMPEDDPAKARAAAIEFLTKAKSERTFFCKYALPVMVVPMLGFAFNLYWFGIGGSALESFVGMFGVLINMHVWVRLWWEANLIAADRFPGASVEA
jgi:hypothetical protein